MKLLGSQLRIIRERLGKSLRDVAIESQQIAQNHGSNKYQISASWLARVENDASRDISAHPLISLLFIYGITLEELLAIDPARDASNHIYGNFGEHSDATILLTSGPGEVEARRLLPDDSHQGPIPEDTELLSTDVPGRNRRFLRVLIGKQRNYLKPIVPAGSLALVDTHRRSLVAGENSDDEIHRPMYLLELRDGHICCWCEAAEKDDDWIIVIPHPCRPMKPLQFRRGKDATIRGRIVAVRIPTLPTEDQ